jgi:two-component system sensor histidine kinase DesK
LQDNTFTSQVLTQLFLVCFLGLMMLFFRRSMLLIAELRVAREELARLAVTEAVAEERLRFARDLHDLLGHSLSGIALKSQLVRRLIDGEPAKAAREIADIEQAAQRALVEVRDAVTGYRQRGLSTELDAARALLTTAGVTVDVDAGPPLHAAVQEPLAWVVREATTNVLRHAFATRCTIVVSASEEVVSVEIRDDGTGSRWRGHFGNGLTGLRERLTGMGGTIEAGPCDGGYVVHAELPVGAS